MTSPRPKQRQSASVKQGAAPQQARSRDRVEKILAATKALIREHGLAALKMSAVARRAGVPIGSVYQYFPTRSVLVARLYADMLADYQELFRRTMEGLETRQQFAEAFPRAVFHMYETARLNPVMLEIYGGVQADRTLQHVHKRDDEGYIRFLYDILRRCGTPIPAPQLRTRLRIVNQMWDGTIRLATSLNKKVGRALIAESINIGLRELGVLG